MLDKQQIIELQNRIVRCFADAVDVKWDFLLINFERDLVEGQEVDDTLAVAFRKLSGKWNYSSIIPPYLCCDLLIELRDSMSLDEKEKWKTCILEVDSRRKYRYSFSYEPPKRLNGELDLGDKFLKSYVPPLL